MIAIDGLTKRFGQLTAVRDLHLEVKAGEIFGFLGPNGAGKTTTIKMMVGLLRPTSGHVQVGGYDMAREPLKAKRLMGYIPDRPYVYEKLTAREFLRFVSHLYGVRSDCEERITELLQQFELADRGTELLESFSHGMRQKVVMASALIHDPAVLIVDEPMVGLDPRSALLLKQIFKKLSGRGLAIFMSTHVLAVAQQLCDRIGIIKDGQLIALGTTAELGTQANREGDLESIFLQLTGGADTVALVKFLSQE